MSPNRRSVRAFGSCASGGATDRTAMRGLYGRARRPRGRGEGRACTRPRLRPVATMALPGFVNAHSHAFQRALRGRTEGGDFWAWRDEMYRLAEGLTPEGVGALYAGVYREMLAAGFTAVGEFHYVGYEEALAAASAAREAGLALRLLYVAYARGGLPRFRQRSVAEYLGAVERLAEADIAVGLAPHSVRA